MSDSTGSPPRIYAFIGRDDFSIEEKLRTWRSAFREKYGVNGITLLDCQAGDNSVHHLTIALQGSGLFQAQTLIVIKNLWSSKKSDIQAVLNDKISSVPPTHFLVITDASMDGRTVLAKTLNQMQKDGRASIELFEIPSGGTLRNWIRLRTKKYGGAFEKNAEDYITNAYLTARDTIPETEASPFDLWYLDNEIRKMVSFAGEKPITLRDVHAISSFPSSAHIFNLTDTVLEKKYKEALHIAHELVGDDATRARTGLLSLISFLLSQFHSFVVMKSMEEDGMNERDVAQHLEWNTKRVWVVSKKISAHSCASLKKKLNSMLDFERILKTGVSDPLLHLDLLIHSLTH